MITEFNLYFFKKKDLPEPLEMPENVVVKVEKVDKIYKQNDREIKALNQICFEVKRGEFFAIVGHSGSGKTSLLSMLGAMEKPTSGKIAINGKTLGCLSEKELTLMRRDEIATIYQNYNLIPVLSAFQNVELPMLLKGMEKEERTARAKKLLDLVGLLDRMDHKPEELSGGEQQRVTIARALSNRPQIILADEPTADLDFEIGEDIIKLLEGINRDIKTTLIMVTHDRSLAKRADRIMSIKKGEIIDIKDGDGKNIREEQLKSRKVKPLEYY